jgi:hypothetical protein
MNVYSSFYHSHSLDQKQSERKFLSGLNVFYKKREMNNMTDHAKKIKIIKEGYSHSL